MSRSPSLTIALLTGAAIAAGTAWWTPGLRVVDGETVDHAWWRWRVASLDAPEIRRAACE